MTKAYLKCVRVGGDDWQSSFSTMPPDKQQAVLDCDGPENHGDPKRRNPTTRLLQHWIDEDGDTLSPTLEQDKADLNAARLKLGER